MLFYINHAKPLWDEDELLMDCSLLQERGSWLIADLFLLERYVHDVYYVRSYMC